MPVSIGRLLKELFIPRIFLFQPSAVREIVAELREEFRADPHLGEDIEHEGSRIVSLFIESGAFTEVLRGKRPPTVFLRVHGHCLLSGGIVFFLWEGAERVAVAAQCRLRAPTANESANHMLRQSPSLNGNGHCDHDHESNSLFAELPYHWEPDHESGRRDPFLKLFILGER